MSDRWKHDLAQGALHRFRDWPIKSMRQTPGAYTIWDQAGRLIYVGIAKEGKKGLRGRLGDHANGGRGGDRFNVYVADRFVLQQLTPSQISEISAGALSFDSLVKEYNHDHFAFRVHETATDTEAKDIEKTIKAGHWPAGRPFLNPSESVSETVSAEVRLSPQPGRAKETGEMTDQELKAALKKFRQHLEKVGYKAEPLKFRMDGASRFALFLADRPLGFGDRIPEEWRGKR